MVGIKIVFVEYFIALDVQFTDREGIEEDSYSKIQYLGKTFSPFFQ